MNVWVRIRAVLDLESGAGPDVPTQVQVSAGHEVTVYRTQELAGAAQAKNGGIILETDAKGLGKIDLEFGNEVLLVGQEDDCTDTNSSAYLSVFSEGTYVPNFGPHEPGTVELQGDVLKPSADSEAWLDELEKETGFRLFQ